MSFIRVVRSRSLGDERYLRNTTQKYNAEVQPVAFSSRLPVTFIGATTSHGGTLPSWRPDLWRELPPFRYVSVVGWISPCFERTV